MNFISMLRWKNLSLCLYLLCDSMLYWLKVARVLDVHSIFFFFVVEMLPGEGFLFFLFLISPEILIELKSMNLDLYWWRWRVHAHKKQIWNAVFWLDYRENRKSTCNFIISLLLWIARTHLTFSLTHGVDLLGPWFFSHSILVIITIGTTCVSIQFSFSWITDNCSHELTHAKICL